MPGWVTQIVSLFQAATSWIFYLAIPAVGLVMGYHALAKSTATDEMVATAHQRALGNTLKYGIITLISTGIVSTVLGFFK